MSKDPLKLTQLSFEEQVSNIPKIALTLESKFRELRTQSKIEKAHLATDFIVRWVYEYTQFQHSFNKEFNRAVSHPASDEFTAAVAFTLEQFLRSQGLKGWVHSEIKLEGIERLRFDIVVKSERNIPVAIIECKTQLGWNRKGWYKQQKQRERKIAKRYPNVLSALCVHRQSNWIESWGKFERAIEKEEKQWVCLLTNDPTNLKECNEFLLHNIESLFFLIASNCKLVK